jgi:hypothetical protein
MITLLNSAAGVKEAQKVTLTTGQLWTRSFVWADGKLTANNSISAKQLTGHAEQPKVEPSPIASAEPKRDVPATHPKAVEGPASGGPVANVAPVAAHPAPAPASAAQAPTTHPAAVAAPASPQGPRSVASFVLEMQKVSMAPVHLPEFVQKANQGRKVIGTYKYCVNRDGHVYDVTTIGSIAGADAALMDTIRTWTFHPQPSNVCSTKVLTFQVMR